MHPAFVPQFHCHHLLLAAGAGPSWPVLAADSGNQQGDAQREHTPMFLSKGEQCVKELQGMEGYRLCVPISKLAVQSEDSKREHHHILIDKEVTTQERNAHVDEAVAVDESTLSLAAEFSVGGSAALPPVASQIKARKVPYHCSVMTTEEQRSKSATDAINELNVTQSSPLLQCSRNKNKRPRGVDDAEADAGSRKSSSKHIEAECPPKKLHTSKVQVEAQLTEESDINTSATQRTKRGPSKMPAGRYVITEFDPTGEPVEPKNVDGPYHTALGVIVRETVPIKYMFWHKKTKPNEKEWCVPLALKEKCWKTLKESFEFPQAYEELAKKRALHCMGISFRYFKYKLNSERVQTGTEPIWEHYPFQRPYWQQFVDWKLSEDALAMSEVNIVNSHKNDIPHHTGSRGYARKIPEWEKQLQQLAEKGVTLHTDGWNERSLRYLFARGMTFNTDGSLSFPSDAVRNLAEKIKIIQEEVANGVFKPDREDDVLTRTRNKRASRSCDDDEEFIVEFHHGGFFVGQGCKAYVDEKISWFDHSKVDTWSPLWLEDFVDQLDYPKSPSTKMYGLLPGLTLADGLRVIESYTETLVMASLLVHKVKNFVVYVDHDDNLEGLTWEDDIVENPIASLPKAISAPRSLIMLTITRKDDQVTDEGVAKGKIIAQGKRAEKGKLLDYDNDVSIDEEGLQLLEFDGEWEGNLGSVEVLRKAVTEYSIKERVKKNYSKNEQKRLKAHHEEGCPWKLYGSVDSSAHGMVLKTYNGTHTCHKKWKLLHLLQVEPPGGRVADRGALRQGLRLRADIRRAVADGLRALGYDAAVCTSRWDKTPSHPAGEHEYIDAVVVESGSGAGATFRLVVEVDFRSEFEVARPTKAYRAALQALPPLFVGTPDRLGRIVAVVAEAARQSLRKRGLHFPPWRKHEYMRAKWLSPHARSSSPDKTPAPALATPISAATFSGEFELVFDEKPKAADDDIPDGGEDKKITVVVSPSPSPWRPEEPGAASKLNPQPPPGWRPCCCWPADQPKNRTETLRLSGSKKNFPFFPLRQNSEDFPSRLSIRPRAGSGVLAVFWLLGTVMSVL
ncbi:unnamed protein product [Miscanthus lutarioriparius]|uniref:PB1-like domain-containing protein n=1 Tax=Miscanthus lutarioriparius TaxID=422564 RepID=A0A811NF61_9POAL|nr:unnamed protein product [Miscanthus lutarioriparius]